jgi:hypothetical protein
MDGLCEIRRLAMVEAYLTDLICDVKNPRHADLLMLALHSVQQALNQLEGKYATQARAQLAP